MNKIFLLIAFSVLLLVPAGAQNAFAGGSCTAGSCNDGNQCTTDTCIPDPFGSGFTCINLPTTGESCDDGNACTTADICVAGACISLLDLPEGSACGSNANNVCTNPDTCDGAGVCLPNNNSDGIACGDSSTTQCTNPDSCVLGACNSNDESSGTACGDSGTQCTNQDFCNSVGVCADNGFVASGTSCEDGEICTVPDICNGAGACTPGPTFPVPACTSDSDGDGIPDGLDECPSDPNKGLQGINGCGTPDGQICGDKTMPVGNVCLPDLVQICGSGTVIQNMMCVAQSIGSVVGSTLLDINTISLLVGAIGNNQVITGLVGITIAGVAGQAVWFAHKRKKNNSDSS